ncbi:MAG: hypothetical protein ABJA98_20260 [Acidobacteriota bacterium]
MGILDLVPEGRREHTLATMQQLKRGDVVAPCRAQRSTKDGRIVDMWITATALVNDTGEPYAVTTTEQRTGEPSV